MGRLLVVVIEHLRQDMPVVGVTIRTGNRNEVWLGNVLPTILKLLGLAATAFREAGIADFTVVCQNLTTGLSDGLDYRGVVGMSNSLITLAMVVGADIEDGVVFAVVSAY